LWFVVEVPLTLIAPAFFGLDISPSERKAINALASTHIPSEKDTRSVQVQACRAAQHVASIGV
jgi:hypothetical protein